VRDELRLLSKDYPRSWLGSVEFSVGVPALCRAPGFRCATGRNHQLLQTFRHPQIGIRGRVTSVRLGRPRPLFFQLLRQNDHAVKWFQYFIPKDETKASECT